MDSGNYADIRGMEEEGEAIGRLDGENCSRFSGEQSVPFGTGCGSAPGDFMQPVGMDLAQFPEAGGGRRCLAGGTGAGCEGGVAPRGQPEKIPGGA